MNQKYGYITTETPIDPGEGWELIPEESLIERGDEVFFRSENSWVLAVGLVGKRAGDSYLYPAVRRRKPAPAKDEFKEWLERELKDSSQIKLDCIKLEDYGGAGLYKQREIFLLQAISKYTSLKK